MSIEQNKEIASRLHEAEEWIQYDVMGVMQQLGAVPPPGQAGS